MPQALDANGFVVPGAYDLYGQGQSVAYTGTAGVIAGAVHTPKGRIVNDSTAPSDGDQVTIGSKTYTFKTALTPAEGEVLINVTAAAAMLNLIRAINHTGTPNTDYKCAAANADVRADVAVSGSGAGQYFCIYSILPDTTLAVSTPVGTHFSWKDALSGTAAITQLGGLIQSTSRAFVLAMITTAGFVKVGAAGIVATTLDIPMAANVPQALLVTPGSVVSAVQSASNGTLYVKEVA